MKTNNTFGILFWINNAKAFKGKSPIYARVTIAGKRSEIALKRSIHPDNWNPAKGKADGTNEEARSLNKYIDLIRNKIYECYEDLIREDKLITTDLIKSRFNGEDEKKHSLLKVFDYHNEEMKTKLEWGTLKNYYTTRAYMESYIKDKYRSSDIFISQLNYQFITGFEKYMKEAKPLDPKKPCGQNTIMKHIERLKKVINLAIKNEWLLRDPFMKFKPTFIHKSREFLTAEELAAIENKEISIDRLQRARDLFVFSCYTGLAYIDVFNLTPQNLPVYTVFFKKGILPGL